MKQQIIKCQLYAADGNNKELTASFDYIEALTWRNLQYYISTSIVTAQKFASVSARKASLGENIETKPLVRYRGKKYTFTEVARKIDKNLVKNGAMVVTDPNGEEYVISSYDKFKNKYKLSGDKYVPISEPLRFIKVTKNLCFNNNGSLVFVPQGSYLCLDDITRSITNIAFETTYNILKTARVGKTFVD